MKNISEIDSNFVIGSTIEQEGIKFYDPRENPFRIYGVFYEDGLYRRMPEAVAKAVSEGVYNLHTACAGGRVRFKTDSPYIAISCKMPSMCFMSFCSFMGTAGFDMYDQNLHIGSFVPYYGGENKGYDSIIHFEEQKMREITINFPSYSPVSELYIGLDEKSRVEEASPYKFEKPIVYYGSSITQGACSSRPGLTYENIVSRKLDCDYTNLGFSGNAKAEDEIAEYIKGLDMAAFVYDYDHNAPTVEHLRNTHERMFSIIREAQPELPIIMMPRPKKTLSSEEKERRSIVEKTYKNAVSAGDKNVYYLSNEELTALCDGEETVEGVHPNDWGFASMAAAISRIIEENNVL